MDQKIRTLYRTVAVIEALTWAGLLVGIPPHHDFLGHPTAA